jgi:hypothetical protein
MNCIEAKIQLNKRREISKVNKIQQSAAKNIQKNVRRKLGRNRANYKRNLKEIQLLSDQNSTHFEPSKIVYYYKLRDEYIKNQNYFHRGYATKIQCAVRKMIAKSKLQKKRQEIFARKIQRCFKLFILRKKAIAEINARKIQKIKEINSIVLLQKHMRGLQARAEYKKNSNSDLIKWFLKKICSKLIAIKAVENFRYYYNIKFF